MNLIALQHAVRHSPAEYAAAPLDAFQQFITQVEQLQAFTKTVREFADQACESLMAGTSAPFVSMTTAKP
jgi:hypothetical protein